MDNPSRTTREANLVTAAGVEPATFGSGDQRSIQLSYAA